MKNKRIDFRCDELEFSLIRKKASDCGLTCSDYCLRVIMGHNPRKRLTDEELRMVTEVRKLAHDLTRITNLFGKGRYSDMMSELRVLIVELKSILYDSKGKDN